MIIKSIRMENFRSHRNTKINFNKGITTIIGQNGSGKSSIFQAMNFALFAPRGSNFKIDNLIQQGSKSFSVELEFEMKGNNYIISRKRHQNKNEDKLYINKVLTAESASEINKKIEEILELDNSVFSNAVYIKQGEIANLIQMTPGDRKEVIGKLLGIEKYEKAHEKMNLIKKNYEERLFEIAGELKQEPEIIASLDQLKIEVSNLENLKNEISEKYENLDIMKIEKNAELKEFEEKFEQISKLKEELKDRLSEIKNISIEIQNFENSLNSVNEESEKLQKNEKSYLEYLNLESKIKELSNKLISHKNDYETYQKLKLREETLKKELEHLKEKLKENSKNVTELKDELKLIDGKIANLELKKEKITKLEFIEKQLLEINLQKNLKIELESDSKIYENVNLELSELKNQKNTYENTLKEKIELEKQLLKEKSEKTKLNSEITAFEEIEKKINLEKELKDKFDNLSEKISKLAELSAGKESRILEIENSKIELEKTKDSCHVCQSKISEEKKKELLLNYISEIENEKSRVKDLKIQIETLTKKKETLNSELDEINKLKPKYGELKEKKNSILKTESIIEELELKLEKLNEDLEKYAGIYEQIKTNENKIWQLKGNYDKYQYSVQYLIKINENEILKEKEELLKIIENYDFTKIQKEKIELENLKDKTRETIQDLEKENLLKSELNEVTNNIYSKIGLVEQYLSWETEKLGSEKRLSELKKCYEIFLESTAVLNSHSKTYSVEISKLNNFLNGKTLAKTLEKEEKNKIRIEIEKEIQNINYNPEVHLNLKNDYEKINNEFNEIGKTFERTSSELKLKTEHILEINKKIEKLALKKEEKQKIESFKEYLEKIKREIFSKDGFQKYLREKYIPLIQRHTNQIFQEFELPYSHIQLKDDYSLVVDGLPVETLSGGEQIAVSLALRLGISKAVCNNIECIILDEPTAYLDEERRKNLLNIFKNIKTINQMAIITHHQELEQIADNLITVRKIGENSKVSSE